MLSLPKMLHTVGLSTPLVAFARELMGSPGWNVTVLEHSCCGAFTRYMDHAGASTLQVPSLFLIDVRHDTAGGLSMARWVKGNEWSRRTPVVLICGAALLSQADSVSWLGINGVVPCDHCRDTESAIVENICHFWLKTNISVPSGWAHSRTGREWVDGCDVQPQHRPQPLAN